MSTPQGWRTFFYICEKGGFDECDRNEANNKCYYLSNSLNIDYHLNQIRHKIHKSNLNPRLLPSLDKDIKKKPISSVIGRFTDLAKLLQGNLLNYESYQADCFATS